MITRLVRLIHISLFCFVGISVAVAVPSDPSPFSGIKAEKLFKVFDATTFKSKPDMAALGFDPIKIVGHTSLWNARQDDSRLPDPIRFLELKWQPRIKTMPVVLDIEHWPIIQADGGANKDNLQKYLDVISRLRKALPGIKLGYYGLPLRDYWRATGSSENIQNWKMENDKIALVIDAQDIVFPSLYTFYENRDGWVKYAVANLEEARRLAKGKPVYAFLWPQYHDSNRLLKLQYLPADYWKVELETVLKYADGVVIWGGAGALDQEAGWWIITKDFLDAIK